MAFILKIINGITDGLNEDSHGDRKLKRIPWTEKPYHAEFFSNARRQLKSMRFVDRHSCKKERTKIPCLENLIDTLEGFKLLWKKLNSKTFKSFNTRNLNEDPLEKFFGIIRSHDFRSNKLTCFQFESIFKLLLITNLTSKNSPGFNCEEGEGYFLLRDCKSLLSGTEYSSHEKNHDNSEGVDLKEIAKETGTGNEYEILQKSRLYSHSGEIIKLLQTKLPVIRNRPQCLSALKKKLRSHLSVPLSHFACQAAHEYEIFTRCI